MAFWFQMQPGFINEKSYGRESETYKNSGPLLLGDGPAPGRGQSAGARDPEGAFKSRSRLSRNGEETPPYGRREGASCDRPQRTDQGNEGPRRSSGAREWRRRNAEELEVRPGQRRNNHPAGVQFPSVSPSGFFGSPCKILITRQGQRPGSLLHNGRPRGANAQGIASLCVGGMVVARTLVDRSLADELRTACMSVALDLGGWSKPAKSKNGQSAPAKRFRAAMA